MCVVYLTTVAVDLHDRRFQISINLAGPSQIGYESRLSYYSGDEYNQRNYCRRPLLHPRNLLDH